jgi:hypothetical protein
MYGELPISGPLGLGDLLDRTFRLYRERTWMFLSIAAVFLVPSGILTAVLFGKFLTDLTTGISFMRFGNSEDMFAMLMGLVVAVLLVNYLLGSLAWLCITHQAVAVLHGERPSLRESILAGQSRLPALVGMNILQGLMMFVPAMLMVLMVAASPCMVFLFPIAIAGWLYLYARWLVVVPGLVAQRWGPVEALRRSWSLTQDHVWRSIGYALLLGILGWLVLSLPQTVMQQALMFVAPVEAFVLVAAISFAISSIFQVVWVPLHSAALVLFYYDLRVRKEGYDLALRVERLEAETGRAPLPGSADSVVMGAERAPGGRRVKLVRRRILRRPAS